MLRYHGTKDHRGKPLPAPSVTERRPTREIDLSDQATSNEHELLDLVTLVLDAVVVEAENSSERARTLAYDS
jgi:hypothetical protein